MAKAMHAILVSWLSCASALIIHQQKELAHGSPVLTWAHKVLRSKKCFSKQHDFRIQPTALTQFGQEYKAKKVRNPGAGIGEVKPFEVILKDGFLAHDCIKDEMFYHGDKYDDNRHSYNMDWVNISVVHYSRVVSKLDRQPMTPEVCFDFCRTVPDMDFFGIRNGRDCYCEPYFKRMAGDDAECSSICEGDNTIMCGSKDKSQIFEMHMCADAVGDLKKGMAELAAAATELDEVATKFTAMAEKGDKDAKDFQDILTKIGDFAATNMLREAWLRAGDLVKLADAASKVKSELTDAEEKAKNLLGDSALLQQGSIATPDFTDFATAKKAEEAVAQMSQVLAKAKSMKEKLETAQKIYSAVGTPEAAKLAENRTKSYYHAYYFAHQEPHTKANYGKDKGTCGGSLATEPTFGLSEDECAYACDLTKGCAAYQFFAKTTTICMLMTKVEEVTHYDMCNHALEGECAPAPPKAQLTTLLQNSREAESATEVPFPWKTKSKASNATLFAESVKDMCTTVYGCEGTDKPVVDCSLMAHYECDEMMSSSIQEEGGVLSMNFAAWLEAGERDTSCQVNPTPCPRCKQYSTCSGPYAETEAVLIKKGDVASYSWKSSGDTDNYEVFVGLYSETCGLVDFQFQRGEEQKWKNFELFSPKTDKYYMKFLLASYDGSGGGAVGADMSVKDVKQTKATVPRIFNLQARCMMKFSEFNGQNLMPDPKGQCKDCFKSVTKQCLKPDETFPVPDDELAKKMQVDGRGDAPRPTALLKKH